MAGAEVEPLTTEEAMTILLVLLQEFNSLQMDDLPDGALIGIFLLFEAVEERVRPFIPKDVWPIHVRVQFERIRDVGAKTRSKYGLPTRQ